MLTLPGITRAHADVAHIARFDDVVQGLHLENQSGGKDVVIVDRIIHRLLNGCVGIEAMT